MAKKPQSAYRLNYSQLYPTAMPLAEAIRASHEKVSGAEIDDLAQELGEELAGSHLNPLFDKEIEDIREDMLEELRRGLVSSTLISTNGISRRTLVWRRFKAWLMRVEVGLDTKKTRGW